MSAPESLSVVDGLEGNNASKELGFLQGLPYAQISDWNAVFADLLGIPMRAMDDVPEVKR